MNSTSILVVCLLLGGILQFFGFGRKMIPVAAWLSPIFLLHASHALPPSIGLPLVLLVIVAAAFFAYREVIPVPGAFYPLMVVAINLPSVLPYVADRLLYARLPGFAAVFVFPVAWIVMEFLTSRLSPYGSWGSIAYTQAGDLPLMQLVSITGLWGVSFLVTWFGSTINWVWESRFDWSIVGAGLLVYAAAWGLVMLAGGLRLAFAKSGRTVRAAVIGWPDSLVDRSAFMRALQPGTLPQEERAALQRLFEEVLDYFLEASRREAAAGSKIIVWPEACAMVFKCDEAELIRRAEMLSSSSGAFVVMGLVSVIEGPSPRIENKAVLVDPSNGVVYSYMKKHPVPGWEAQVSLKSDERMPSYASPYGLIGSSVCFDMDFPDFVRQAARRGLALLLVPASDWEAIKDLHHIMASVRAVEDGSTLVRAARWGVSAAVDPYGRTLALTDSFAANQDVTVANVPFTPVPTLYARLGDWFAWLCVIGLATTLIGRLFNVL